MKRIFTAILLSTVICTAYAQDNVNNKEGKPGKTKKITHTYVSPTATLKKNYTQEELKALGKIELVGIYMERISVLTELVPYIALRSKPGSTLNEMGIPSTDANIDHMMKEVKNKQSYLLAVKNTLDDIIPYADKTNIIWSILFIEDCIKTIEHSYNSDEELK